MKPKEVAETVEQIKQLHSSHSSELTRDHVLAGVAGLGGGAMPPTSQEAIKTLGAHIVALHSQIPSYPAPECAEALIELARAVPAGLATPRRVSLRLAFRDVLATLTKASQGEFTEEQANAYLGRLGALPQLALPK